jgi:uncharacterized protein (TIGR02271 family)
MSDARDHAVTRSEEELVVDTVWRPTERVRLIRRVVEEEVSVTVRVRREELHVERQPVSEFEQPDSYRPGRDDLVVVLREERPVVGVEVVPRELVRVRRYLVDAGEERISDSLRKEVIEIEGVDDRLP